MQHSNWQDLRPKVKVGRLMIERLQADVIIRIVQIIIGIHEMNLIKHLMKIRVTDEDITTVIEKLEKQKSVLFGSSTNFSKTVSMPAWSSSQSSQNSSLSSTPSSSTGGWPQFRDRPTNYSLSSSQMSSSPVSRGKMSSSSSSWRCSGSSYNDDRLLQMDWSETKTLSDATHVPATQSINFVLILILVDINH